MKKVLISLICMMGLVLAAASAQALTYYLNEPVNNYYVGYIIPDTSAGFEKDYLTILIGLDIDETFSQPYNDGKKTRYYSREGSSIPLEGESLPPLDPVVYKEITPKLQSGTTFTAPYAGNFYILGKYSDDAMVWLVTGANAGDIFDLQDSWLSPAQNNQNGPGQDLSHYSIWGDPDTPPVPEPGTIVLLGAGLLGLGLYGRRRMKAK